MKQTLFEEKLNKAWGAVWDIELFNYALIFITSFLVTLLAFILIGIPMHFAFIPALAMLGLAYLKDKRTSNPIKTIEASDEILADRLSAAYDNREKDSFIVKDLIGDVTYALENLKTDVFLDMGRTGLYVGTSIIVIFILLSLMLFDPFGFGTSGLFGGGGGGGQSGSQGQGSGSGGGSGSNEAGDSASTQDISMGLGASRDIYGDVSIAKIEGNEMQLEIHPEYGEQGELGTEESEVQGPINEIKDGFVQAVAAESYSENIPVEMENVVRGYFERIANE